MKSHTHPEDPKVTVITVDGSINTETGPDFAAAADEVISGGARQIVVDFSELKYLTSYGLGMLVMLHSKIAKAGGEMKLSGMKSNVRQVLVITRVERLFDIHPDVDSASRSFA